MGGGGTPSVEDCLPAGERFDAALEVAHYRSLQRSSPLGVPEKFTFYPLAGQLYRDLFTNNFVDLMSGPGLLDWDCTDVTYDGHDATDVLLRSFGEQLVGVPVFSALDGIVVATHDGEDDMHTACAGTANYVIIDHGAGRLCYYWHLREDSVQVVPGQPVSAGQQLGLAASSGCSTWPHLHFATYDDGLLVEPYAGVCNPVPSQWAEQTPIDRELYLNDFNLTNADIGSYPGLPFDMPRRGTFEQGVRSVRFWIQARNLPASSHWRVRYVRPDGSIAFDSVAGSFGAPAYRSSWWWWSYSVNLNTTGPWHLRLNVNGAILAEVPFDVVATAAEIVNRPPAPVGASLWPLRPRATDVLECRVDTDLLLDDPDYDIVRYHYVWSIDGTVVRDVISAGHSDVLARDMAPPGSFVTCEVTPTDGIASAPSALAGTIIRPISRKLPMPAPLDETAVGPR
jgi:hypothetical protein